MSVINPPPVGNLTTAQGGASNPFRTFLDQVYLVCFSSQSSGTTANRPTKKLWIGRFYFDTTLTRPIWISAVSAAGVATWIRADGVVV